jgi:hypothetical protein
MEDLVTLDPLSSLEIEEGLLPARITEGLPELKMPTDALEEARSEIIDLQGKLAAEKARADVLEDQLHKLGDVDITKLSAEIALLKAELAKRDAQAEAEVDTERLLPAVVEARGQMLLLEQKYAGESYKLGVALQASEARLGEVLEVAKDLEYQRDERDDMLRKEEAARQQSDRKRERVARQIALVRLTHIRTADPAKGSASDVNIRLARTRLLAALGNVGAQVELGRMDGQCALCDADPGCVKERLLNWPHGTLVPRDIQDYLQLIVDEATDRGTDPFTALESWASGNSMESFDPKPQCDAVSAEGARCAKESGRHTVHTPEAVVE